MIYAVIDTIQNNIITNIIEANEDFAKHIGAVKLEDGYGIGDYYFEGEFYHASEQLPTETVSENPE